LLRPGTTGVNQAGSIVAGSTNPGSTESFGYVPPEGGTYFLDVSAAQGRGSYVLEALGDLDGDLRGDQADNCPAVSNFAQEDRDGDHVGDACDRFPDDPANDADGDGIGADVDNCPLAANRAQRNWDADRRGDACDRSARVTLRRASVRGLTIKLTGTVRPVDVDPGFWRVRVQHRVCSGGRCRYRDAGERRGARSAGGGRVRMTLRLRQSGRYRFQAVLRSPKYNTVRSRLIAVRLHR
jgi:Thrombospondin type 3 repeat